MNVRRSRAAFLLLSDGRRQIDLLSVCETGNRPVGWADARCERETFRLLLRGPLTPFVARTHSADPWLRNRPRRRNCQRPEPFTGLTDAKRWISVAFRLRWWPRPEWKSPAELRHAIGDSLSLRSTPRATARADLRLSVSVCGSRCNDFTVSTSANRFSSRVMSLGPLSEHNRRAIFSRSVIICGKVLFSSSRSRAGVT